MPIATERRIEVGPGTVDVNVAGSDSPGHRVGALGRTGDVARQAVRRVVRERRNLVEVIESLRNEHGSEDLFPNDLKAVHRLIPKVKAGTVWINSHGGVHPMIPFGGIKGSGYGLEFGTEGLKSVSVPQVING